MEQKANTLSSDRSAIVNVTWAGDVREAAETAKRLANGIGFPAVHCEEIGLVATELASNVLRHASHGSLQFTLLDNAEHKGIQIESKDHGPGISDVERAVIDGYSTAGGPGYGLGTVNRLMDTLEVHSREGLQIICKRWLRPSLAHFGKSLVVGAATRAYRFMPENGDAFVAKQWDGYALLGVIDGLGHGPFAQRASQTARQYVEQHFDQPFEYLFRGVARACRATRGVVMALARFDFGRQMLTVASVGNIEVRLLGSPEHFRPIIRRGILGLNAPSPVSTEHPWSSECLLVMHSDGVHFVGNGKDLVSKTSDTPDSIAQYLLKTCGKMEDDATVVVARSAQG